VQWKTLIGILGDDLVSAHAGTRLFLQVG